MQNPAKRTSTCGLRAWPRRLAWLVAAACQFAAFPSFRAADKVKPPIILISVDTLRADHLGSYGYQHLPTPNIDALADGGTLFSQVNAQVPLTLPSHVSLFTSTYPFVHGIEENGERLAPRAVTLAAVLRAQGYRTAGFVGGFVMDRRFGLDQSFDVYDSRFDTHREAGKDPGDIKRPGEEVAGAATRWLEENAAGPFFLFLHLYDLHTPYNLPPDRRARFRGSGYDAELEYVDEVLGRFWDFLRRQGLLKKCLIVFTSDHGEGLGEHGEATHGYFIYQSTLRVPLIIHWPASARPAAARVDEPVSLLDVAPTILQFAEVPRPKQFQGRSLLGLAYRPATESPAASKLAGEPTYSESFYARNHFGSSPLRCLRVGKYKYIEAPRPEFYDLSRDAGETQNLYAKRKSLALSFREQLLALRTRFQGERLAAGSQVLSPEVVERLSSLGYMTVSRARSTLSDSGADPKDRISSYEMHGRALTLASSGRLAEANAILGQLLAQDPNLLDVRLSLGLNRQALGQHAQAAQDFREVLKSNPVNALAHFNLAVSLFELRELDAAIKELEVALAIAPYYTRAENLLARIWMQKEDYARAQAHLTNVLRTDPADYTALNHLGVLATMQSRWEEAERHLRAALDVDPAAAEAHNTLGSVYLRRGDLERASGEFRQAVRLDPKFAWAHYNLGLVLRRQGQEEEATREFRRALEADPKFHAARAALDRLRPAQD